MTVILGFFSLFKYWRMWLVIGLIAAVIGGVGFLVYDFKHMKSELALAQTNIATLTTDNKKQVEALNECSDATAQMQQSASKWAAQAFAAQAAANQQSETYTQKAQTIMAQKPAAGVSDYDATQQLINQVIQGLKQ